MDFSPLSDTLASKSYGKLADICDQLMLQVAAEGVDFQDDWPYAIHLLALIYAGDINGARFLWKSMPVAVKESNPEVIAAWKIGQKLWMRDYGGVYEAIRGYEWSQDAEGLVAAFSDLYTKKMFQLLQSAYSTISIQDTALFLGMSEDDVTTYVLQQGWVVDPASQMVTVKKQPIVTEQKLDRNGEWVHQLAGYPGIVVAYAAGGGGAAASLREAVFISNSEKLIGIIVFPVGLLFLLLQLLLLVFYFAISFECRFRS